MVIIEDTSNNEFQIQAYSSGKIVINKVTYTQSLIISPSRLITHWEPQTLKDVRESDFTVIKELNPEIVILGTGDKFEIPNSQLQKELAQEKWGTEYMDTASACRTFIALSSEGRNVIAALLINGPSHEKK